MGSKGIAAGKDNLGLEKLPPQNLEAEQALLGSMLLDKEAIGLAIETVKPECFYKEAHREIFNSIISLYDSNQPVDLVTLTDKLQKSGNIDLVGGATYLTDIVDSVPTSANVKHYATIVKEKYILRSLINVSTQIITQSYQPEVPVDDVLDKAEQHIFEIASGKVEGSSIPMKDIIQDSIETIDNLYQRKDNVTGVRTGFKDFDVLTAGLQNSDLIVIAGRPSMGKSALASTIAEYASIEEKLPVAIFSLEMSKEQLVQRILCSHAKVNAHKVRTGFLSQSDWPKLTNAAGRLSEVNIYIDDTPGISALELRAKARRLKSRHDIKLLILDYLQLMRGGLRTENRQQEISEISNSLKALARELSIPIIAISQLSRAVETRINHRPQLSDLRESGSIEQDADVVVLLLREEYYNPTEDNKGIAELIIAKQRNGPVGTVNLAFLKEYARFENLDTHREVPI